MALNRQGMDLKAIKRDQKAIDALPNHGRAKSKALEHKKKSYTGHYQEDASGKIRHQSEKQVEKKGLNKY